MIGDVGSTNDFFLKSDTPKRMSQAEQTALDMKPTGASASVASNKKNEPKKTEFSQKLKSAEKNKPAEKTTEPKDRFSKETSSPRVESPIQKRAPASDKAKPDQEIESTTDRDTLSSRNRFKSARPDTQAKSSQAQGEEDEDSVASDSSTVKNEPNMQLLSVVASPQFDVKDLSPSELKEVKEALRDQQAEVKQASVQKFMNKLQTQFGITPDKVVQAFAKMDEKTLTAPPSETVSQFVNNLDAKGAARGQIANLYKQMLSETGEAALNEKLLGADDDSQSVSLKVMDTTQAKLTQLNKSLDSLNDNFFRKGEFQQQQQIPSSIRDQLKKLTEANQDLDDEDESSPNSLGAMLAQLDNKAGALAAVTGGAAAAATETSAAGAGATSAAATQAPVMDMSAFAKPQGQGQGQGKSSFGQGESSQQESSRGTKAYSAAQQNNGTAKNIVDASKMNVKADGSQVKTASAGTVSNQINPSAVVGGAAAGTAVGGSTAAALTPGQMMMTGPNKQDTAENVQELIKQAQIIVKKGGGEMNVEMKPEGMGQVHLKVALENGQVNIQMMAQNDKVKKLLEDGIHELKSNLAAHKIQVESLKIGIANGALAEKKMEHQQGEAQKEAMRDAQREAASNFAGDMRDQRQDRNSGFTDVPGWRAYRTDAKRVSVEASPEQLNASSRRDENRRLSLIA